MKKDFEKGKYRKLRNRAVSLVTALLMLSVSVPVGDYADGGTFGSMLDLSGVSDFLKNHIQNPIAAEAEEGSPAKQINDTLWYDPATSSPKTDIIFANVDEFIDYSYWYVNDSSFASAHSGDRLTFSFNLIDGARSLTPTSTGAVYHPLGTAANAFHGTVVFSVSGAVTSYDLTSPAPLFDYIRDDAVIGSETVTLHLTSTTDADVLLANHVVHGNGAVASWKLVLASGNTTTYSSVIGCMEAGAKVNIEFTNASGSAVNATESDAALCTCNAGTICGTMKSGSELTVSLPTSTPAFNVTSAHGNAGGLVGEMQSATLVLKDLPEVKTASTVTASAGYAGGLVGYAVDSVIQMAKNTNNESIFTVNGSSATVIPVAGSVTGAAGAGGLFGYYGNAATANGTFDMKDFSNTASVYGQYCGGLFGVLENKRVSSAANTMTITNTDTSGNSSHAVTSRTGDTYDMTGYFGGLIGQYKTDHLTNTLALTGLTYSVTAADSFNAFGGAIGLIDGAAYVSAENVTVTASGTAERSTVQAGDCEHYAYFGGLVGATDADNGDLIDLGDFKLTVTDASGFNGGGIVGQFCNGVLRLHDTTDMSAAKPAGAYATTDADGLRYAEYGQLVGFRDNVLVYARGTGNASNWIFNRSNGAISDDIGTWGEVVRSVDDSASTGAIRFDSTAHTVTLAAAVTTMDTPDKFVRTALNIQLNQGVDYDCLVFADKTNSKRNTLLGGTLTIGDNISLSGTGINGFMRDGSGITVAAGDNNTAVVTSGITSSAIGGVGTFTGTLNGGSKVVTLAIGEPYGVYASGQTEGIGQIYRHQYNGLFSVIGNGTTGTGTVNNLTVAGTLNIRNAGADGMTIGGIAARSHGNTTLSAVSVLASGANALTVNYHEGAIAPGTVGLGKNIGGFIGYADANTDNGTLAITGTSYASPKLVFTGSHQNWMVYGGAIGKIASPKITVNIEQTGSTNLTVGMQTDVTGVNAVGENADCGGLIGYIISNGSYGDRVVNISNLIFNGCQVSNCGTKTAGGFLGYAWYDATANINGVTVTSGTINNTANSSTATDVGVMCYAATGKWVVDSLTVTEMTMSSGGGSSLGMLVNKAYNGTSGLYLDVLNSGYTLTNSGITLPGTIKVFDELAVDSASDVIAGNGGVVSVNMTTRAGTDPKITTTGTYQNQISRVAGTGITAINAAKYANNKSRYYYNLDRMSNADYGQNLLLWSVSKYAASNISGEFVQGTGETFGTTITDTLGGTGSVTKTADMTGLSFYPLKNAGSYTIGNLALTFDYEGIYNTAETIFLTGVTTDGYNRDPGASNQHYLMHSGLFMYLPKDKTLSVTGKLTLAGTFLEKPAEDAGDAVASGFSGVLISRTMNGSFVCEDGSIELAGLTPKTTAAAAYTDGYLLINNIVRASVNDPAPEVIIHNLYTGSGYTGTLPVASSLLGAATGDNLTIKFSHVKLDARKTAVSSGNAALDTAYNTTRSIFKDAVFLRSIMTDPTAILEYYYTYAEDWEDGDDADTAADRFVTYGKEVKDTLEYQENGVSLESRYSGATRNYTNPESSAVLSSPYNFSGWLPYVKQSYVAPTGAENHYRELKVNVEYDGPLTGCGTYNHPYEITTATAEQFVVAAKFLSTGSEKDLNKIRLPIAYVSYDTLAENTTGSRWCASKTACAVFTLAASGTNSGNYVYNPTPEDPTKEIAWTSDNVRLYLANAYFKINGNIVLGKNFAGLGSVTETSGNYAFRGVIVGEKNANGTPRYTITNKSTNPFINVSNGSVIKDLNIDVAVDKVGDAATGVIELSQSAAAYNTAYFGYNSHCAYYGGIIGEVMGGDNIIDNSYVRYAYTDTATPANSFATKIVLTDNGTNKYGTLIPVGGYVGAVVFGGLIFKNMTAANTTVASTGLNVVYKTNTLNLASDSAKQAIYVNPIVGRVINGYAVNETDTTFSVREGTTYHDDGNTSRTAGEVHLLKNGSKHYPIADIARSTEDGARNATANQLAVTPPTSATADGTITIPNDQAMFILSLITQSGAGTAETARGAYTNSLSYGTNTTVYGMSHIAEYVNVGTASEDTDTDYVLAKYDTAANTALPYIIKWYTNGDEGEVNVPAHPQAITTLEGLTGKGVYISNTRSDADDTTRIGYLVGEKETIGTGGVPANQVGGRSSILKSTDGAITTATIFYFNKVSINNTDYYTISFTDTNNQTKYLNISHVSNGSDGGNIEIEDAPITNSTLAGGYFTLSFASNKLRISANPSGNKPLYISQSRKKPGGVEYFFYNSYKDINDKGAQLDVSEIVPGYKTYAFDYSARCVTSATGSYDITLTGSSYVLPDSFRGLGCVGNYNDQYKMKIDQFSGTGRSSCTIDADIYLNKFQYDNYFNNLHSGTTQVLSGDNGVFNVNIGTSNHGIGLFDSVKTKDASSKFTNFTLSGSVNEEIYNNTYSNSSHELSLLNTATAKFLSVGGVCGAALNNVPLTFDQITLDGLSVCGSCIVGGLLGFSGNDKSVSHVIQVTGCYANDLSVKMNSSSEQESIDKARNAIGGFVGKCYEGKVKVTGDTTDGSTVSFKAFEFETAGGEYRCAAGGLVGFAGDGCQAYHMTVKTSDNNSTPITIGGAGIRFAGGICGAMQSKASGTYEKTENGHNAGDPIPGYEATCLAVFQNCTVENINFKGQFVGGFYGGKWGTTGWTPYSITIDNCSVIGNTTTPNTIEAVEVYDQDANYAGGFIGRALVLDNGSPNILIQDSKVSDYIITGSEYNSKYNYCGGFMGYAGSFANNSSITCYIHDSSVEDCLIGASGDYAGGAIGHVATKTGTTNINKLLGFNIKLDNVDTTSGSHMGAWIGHVDDTKTSIQFSGMAMYEHGYTDNIGDGTNISNAAFVFADYTGASKNVEAGTTPAASGYHNTNNVTMNENVDTPKYPYVTVFPQSAMGTSTIISGDAAKLLSDEDAAADYEGYTSYNTIAARLLADKLNANGARYYSTFANSDVATKDGDLNTFASYFEKTVNGAGNRISTYATEKGSKPNNVDDFAVLTITNQDDTETTNLINRYIQLLTNTNTDYTKPSNYYDVVVKSCVYENNNFVLKEENQYAPGLTFTKGADENTAGKFALNPGGIDSISGSTHKFTMIDVQFLNPFNAGTTSEKIVYHLYVPVYTIKSLNASFYSTVKSGTTYKYTDYSLPAESYKLVMESFGNWITARFRYTYEASEIQVLLDEGALNWNSDKAITLQFDSTASGSQLPSNADLVLIDANCGADKAYYAKGSDLDAAVPTAGLSYQTINLSQFYTAYGDNNSEHFTEQHFGALISGIVTVDTTQAGHYEVVTSGAYDIQVGDTKYRFNSANDQGLKLKATEAYTEEYYMSVRIPTDEDVYLFGILSSGLLDGTIITYVENPRSAYGAMLFGDLYDQDFEYAIDPGTSVRSSDGSQLITENNRVLTVRVTSKINLKANEDTSYYATQLSSNHIAVYHSNLLTLNKHELDGSVSNIINGTNQAHIARAYTISSQSDNSQLSSIAVGSMTLDSSGMLTNYVSDTDLMPSYINACSEEEGYDYGIQKYLTENVNGAYPGARVTQIIQIDFTDIESEFPERTAEQNNVGVNVLVSSNLSYVEENLPYSSKKVIYPDGQYFYIEDTNSATLTLRADRDIRYDLFDVWGNASYNESLLGINGYSRSSTCNWSSGYQGMPISATAVYNTSGISNFATDAKQVKYIVQLYKKTDVLNNSNGIASVEYRRVNIADYLNNVVLTGGHVLTPAASSTATEYVYIENIYNGVDENDDPIIAANMEDQIFTAKLDFEVKTGGDFKEYANYQVLLIEELLDARGNVISNSLKRDWIVYTNAKLRPEFLTPTAP